MLLLSRFGNLADCHMARFKSLDVDKQKELERYKTFAEEIRPLVVETVSFLHQNIQDGKHILVEGANAAMLDIDFGNLTFYILFIYLFKQSIRSVKLYA